MPDEFDPNTGIGEPIYARRGEEPAPDSNRDERRGNVETGKPAPVVITPEPAEATVPKMEPLIKPTPPNVDVGYMAKCQSQLLAIQKAWNDYKTAGLSWTDVHSVLRPIIEKPTEEF